MAENAERKRRGLKALPVPTEEDDLHRNTEWMIYENKLQCRPQTFKQLTQAARNDMFRIGQQYREEDEDGLYHYAPSTLNQLNTAYNIGDE